MGEVTVIAELLEHGLIQSQRSDHAVRRQVEYRADSLFQHIIGIDAGMLRIHRHRYRLCLADGIGKADGAALGQSCRYDILGNVTGHVRAAAVHLRSILAGQRAAAMRSEAAVGIHHQLASGESGVRFKTALDKSTGRIASVIGRYYAMDRDNRWERVKEAYDLIVNGIGTPAQHVEVSIQQSYDEGITDEFIKPIVHVGSDHRPVGVIEPGDMVIFFNYRNDRAKELTIVLTQEDMPAEGMHTMPLYYCCMTPYDAKFTGLHILFDKENVPDTIGEWVSKQGLKQLRIAETEKYAHVTFFLNGGREEKFDGEERILVASPKVATYDLQPEMSAPEVAEKLVAALGEKKFDFICLNFANGDMVGHTGVYEAIVKAVKAVDKCVSEVVEAARANGYEVVMIADHGNADNAVNADGTPNTAHSLNPVPIVVVSDRVKSVRSGILADVAPTVLKLMGLEQPAEMTGKALVEMK